MPSPNPRPRESTGRSATRSGATVGLATVLGALVAPRLPGIDATAASVLVGSVLGALAGLGAAIGTVARDRVDRGHDGWLTQLLATLLALPLVLLVVGCGTVNKGPHLTRHSCGGQTIVVDVSEGGTYQRFADGTLTVSGPALVCETEGSQAVRALLPLAVEGARAAAGVP